MKHHVMSVRTSFLVFGALLGLLLLTVGASELPLGSLHFPIAMAFATAKAVLIVLFFMHLLHSHRLTMIISVASFLWLAILVILSLNDYLSRGELHIPGK